MPNVKIYLDQQHWKPASDRLQAAFPELTDMLCRTLEVDRSAVQLALLGVAAPDGQPAVNVELHLLPRPDRTREALTRLGGDLRDKIALLTGLRIAVRIGQLDPQTYVALK